MAIVMWECSVYDPSESKYDMILAIYLLIELGLNLKFPEHIIKGDDRPFEWCTSPTIYLGMNELKI